MNNIQNGGGALVPVSGAGGLDPIFQILDGDCSPDDMMTIFCQVLEANGVQTAQLQQRAKDLQQLAEYHASIIKRQEEELRLTRELASAKAEQAANSGSHTTRMLAGTAANLGGVCTVGAAFPPSLLLFAAFHIGNAVYCAQGSRAYEVATREVARLERELDQLRAAPLAGRIAPAERS